MLDNNRIWTKEYIMIMAANFFVALNFYALMTTVAAFALSDLGVTETKAGFGAGVFVIGALISRIVVSHYSVPRYFKKMLIIGIVALIVFTALLFTVHSFVFFCIIRFFGGVTFGTNNNTLNTWVTHIIPPDRKGEGLGWYSLSQTLGMAIGPFFAVTIMHMYGYREVFLFAVIVAVISFVIILFVKQREFIQETPAPTPEKPASQGIWGILDRNVINITILLIIIYVCNSNYMTFAAVFVTKTGAPAISSLIFLANAGAMLVSRPILGKLFDKYGPNKILVSGFILFAAGLFLLGRGAIPLFIPASLLIGLGISCLQGTTLAVVISNTPKHRLAMANATYFIALDFGAFIGPTIGGGIIEQAGYSVMYIVFAAVSILCLPLYFGALGKRYQNPT